MNPLVRSLAPLAIVLSVAGCATYIPPGPKADLQVFAPPGIEEGFALKPTCPFPAAIAAVRVQAPDYSNYNLAHGVGSFGTGRYTVITTREVEDQSQIDRVLALPQVAGIATLNRMLLPEQLNSDREIREAASRLQADMVLIYTFDTKFFSDDASVPLAVITLGLSPTHTITAVTTVSALLLDTRTGYVYSAYEATEREAKVSTSWGSGESADEARRATERRAFAKLIDDFVNSWPRLLDRYQRRVPGVGH